MSKSGQSYGADKIRILENLEPVRLRPAMYIGDTGVDGLHHLVEEVVDNAVDEFMDGHVTAVGVKIDTEDQVVTVIDNGRGIPVTKDKKTKLPMLTAVLTKLHSGGKFGRGAYTSAVSGLHGIGIKATNALSEKLTIWTVQKKSVYKQSFEKGLPVAKMRKVKSKLKRGTRVRFQPDFSIFKGVKFDPDRIRERLQSIAHLCPGLIIEYRVDDGDPERFHSEHGIQDMLDELELDNELHAPFYISDDQVELALVWTENVGESWKSFVNVMHTPDHGAHVTGAKRAIQKVLRDNADKKLGALKGDDLRDGLVAIIHAHVKEPQFRGQTKRSLQNKDVDVDVARVVEDAMRKFVVSKAKLVKYLTERAAKLRDAKKELREQQKALRKTKVKKGARNVLPGKLCAAPDCTVDERELFIVEGNSAMGTVQPARVTKKGNRHFQEVLPLRGKVLNAAKVERIDKVLKNEQLSNITQAIGTGIGPSFDLSKCRYKSIFLLMDADADGDHIATLLLAFFVKYMPELIKAGKLYVVNAPLFMGVTAKARAYGNTIEEVREQLPDTKNIRISRFKGLGESDAEDLQVYAMHPKTRDICQVEWGGDEDGKVALRYMEEDATVRKELMGIGT